MTKFTLLAAASLAALALAGGAQASSISGAQVSGVALNTTATVPTVYTVANEAKYVAADFTTAAGTSVTVSLPAAQDPLISSNSGAGASYYATFALTGATFSSPVVAADFASNAAGTCVDGTGTTFIVTSGGGVGQNSVTVRITVGNNTVCTATGANIGAKAVTLTAPFATAAKTGVSVTAGFNVETSGAPGANYGGAHATANLVQFADYRVASVTPVAATANALVAPAALATNNPTQLAIGTGVAYRTFTSGSGFDSVLGYLGVTKAVPGASVVGGTIYSNLKAALASADTAVTFTPTVTGNTANLALSLQPLAAGAVCAGASTALTNASDNASASTAVPVAEGLYCVNVAPAAGITTGIAGGAYTATVTPTAAVAATKLAAPAATGPSAIETIQLEGTNFIAPWVGGSQAATKSVIRLSNGNSAASGPVTIRLNNGLARAAGVTTGPGSAVAQTTCSTTFVIPTTGDLQIGQGELKTCFGDFLRGDLQITVQSAAGGLTAKMRQVEADGKTYESTLGRFSGSPATAAAF